MASNSTAVSLIRNQSADLLTNEQAAEYIGITPRTLEVWRSTKRYVISYIRVGRKIRYRREALDAFLDSRTVDAEAGK